MFVKLIKFVKYIFSGFTRPKQLAIIGFYPHNDFCAECKNLYPSDFVKTGKCCYCRGAGFEILEFELAHDGKEKNFFNDDKFTRHSRL